VVKLSEIYAVADGISPKRLSDEYCEKYGAYDNSGVLVDCGEDIQSVVFSLDLSFAAIEKAISTNANLIITHHPAIYGKIGDICVDSPLGNKLIRCIKNGVSIIAMHLNLDGAQGGVDESLRDGICIATNTKTVENQRIMHPLSTGGYGRVYTVQPCGLKTFQENVSKEFSTDKTIFYGDCDKRISRVASFCGAGVDEEAIAFAKRQNADVIVSSDFKHHLIGLALESGLAVVVLPHYASENYGFKKYYEKIRRQLDIPCVYHTDGELL